MTSSFVTTAWIMLTIVVVGFAPSYLLRGAVFAPLPSLLVHLHGAVFFSWIILFVVQTSLVATGNRASSPQARSARLRHRRPDGHSRRAGSVRNSSPRRCPAIFLHAASFLIGNVLGILYFGIFVAVAVWQRNNRPVHKRIMFIANLMLMSPALSRMPFMQQHPFLIGGIPLGLIAVLFVFDLFTWKRPLWVTVIAGFLYWVFDPVSDVLIKTPLAQQITLWAQHHP